jgi:hypothetical protein
LGEEGEQRKKKRRKKEQQLILLTEEQQKEVTTGEEKLRQLTEILEKLKEEGKHVDIQICPHCKSAKIRRVGSMSGDILGQMALTPPKFECEECGWMGRLTLYATNRRIDRKHIALVNEVYETAKKKKDKLSR